MDRKSKQKTKQTNNKIGHK